MEMLAKAADAGMMFWQSLDERERMLLVYGCAWVLVALLARAGNAERTRLKIELLEELRRGDQVEA